MISRNAAGVLVIAATALGIVGLEQVATQASGSQERTAPEQQVTVTGCVQREADYRRARDAGRGGVAGTGVGAGNEYVVMSASITKGTGRTTTATAEAETAYELTGPDESKAGEFVGKRVEISGKLKAAEVTPSSKPTGGVTAGKPPEGVEIAGQDLKLRELEIATIREVPGTCPSR